MTTLEKAREYLNKDRLHHIDMLESIDRGDAELLYADSKGVLLLNTACGVYLISAEDEETLDKMCGDIMNPLVLTSHQAYFRTYLSERFGMMEDTECYQCAYPFLTGPDIRLPEGVELRVLTAQELDFVAEHYTHIPIREYIEERINAGMIGAYVDNGPAGFIGVHDDGSMGMLEVLPEYRRMGIAYTLEAAMINRMLAQHRTPYVQVIKDNAASISLQQKLGMRFSDQKLVWLFAGR